MSKSNDAMIGIDFRILKNLEYGEEVFTMLQEHKKTGMPFADHLYDILTFHPSLPMCIVSDVELNEAMEILRTKFSLTSPDQLYSLLGHTDKENMHPCDSIIHKRVCRLNLDIPKHKYVSDMLSGNTEKDIALTIYHAARKYYALKKDPRYINLLAEKIWHDLKTCYQSNDPWIKTLLEKTFKQNAGATNYAYSNNAICESKHEEIRRLLGK